MRPSDPTISGVFVPLTLLPSDRDLATRWQANENMSFFYSSPKRGGLGFSQPEPRFLKLDLRNDLWRNFNTRILRSVFAALQSRTWSGAGQDLRVRGIRRHTWLCPHFQCLAPDTVRVVDNVENLR